MTELGRVGFAYGLPWWGTALLGAALALAAWSAYRRMPALAPRRRWTLVVLRAMSVFLLAAILFDPVRLAPSAHRHEAVVPILVDASRSMRLAGENGARRIDRAGTIARDLAGTLEQAFDVETLTFSGTVAPVSGGALAPDGARTDLAGALSAVRERYHGRTIAGLVVVSDGGDTGGLDPASAAAASEVPVFAVGVGEPLARDQEVVALQSSDASIGRAVVELTATVASRGIAGATEVRLLADGQPLHVRRIPLESGVPARVAFFVTPAPDRPTLYAVEIPVAPGDAASENNRRSLLVEPPSRKRRVLFIEGAPGFEHGFVKRAWQQDPELEVDAVVRKGRSESGQDVFLVQADASRAAALAGGFPPTREALFVYDAVVFGNVEWDFLRHDHLQLAADFVSERGGGLLVFGARSFAGRALAGTPLADVLPVSLGPRAAGVVATSGVDTDAGTGGGEHKVRLTGEGRDHPLLRLSPDAEESVKRWESLPPLAAVPALGAPRPGATLLATLGTGRQAVPAVTVQRYGRGRSMVFGAEASFRWQMEMPSADGSFERFWRQAARWLSSGARERLTIDTLDGLQPGETAEVRVRVDDELFRPVRDASVSLRAVQPDGASIESTLTPRDAASGVYAGPVTFDRPGVYRLSASGRDGSRPIGAADRWVLVGGADSEFADSGLNWEVLSRLAAASAGAFFTETDAGRVPERLARTRADVPPPAVQHLWRTWLVFVLIVSLLSAEWYLRRRWGLR